MSNEITLVAGDRSSLVDTIETFYTAPVNSAVLITAFSASNATESNKTYKAYIYSSTGVAEDASIPQTILVRDAGDFGALIVGHLIPAGGSLRMESSAANSVLFRATGRLV